MANSVDLHLNIQNSLEKHLTKSNKQMTSFNDLLSESDLATGRIKKNWIGTVNVMDKARGALRRIGSTARDLVPTLGVIFSTAIVVESTREVIKHSQAFRELAHRMGDGVDATRQYTRAMTEASRATGLATEDISELIVDLRSLRVPLENIQEAAVITAQFSEVTGVASNSSARLYGELMRTGRMSEQVTQGMMLGMARVQDALGLSSAEAETLADGLVTITQRMNQLGKSAQETQKMTKGTVALAAAFSKVGIEASKALDIITDLLDPEQVENNAFLYAKLGISISDAFEGNVDIVGQMIPRMRELGQQMQNMSGPAAAAMAKSLGMPLQVLRQFGEIDMSQIPEMQRLMTEEGMNAADAFATMQSKTRGLDKIISAIGNQIRAVIGGLADNLGQQVGDIVERIRNFDLSSVIESLTAMGAKALEFAQNIDLGEVVDKLINGIQTFIGFIGNIPKMIPVIGVAIFMLFRTMRRRAYTAFTGMGKDFNKELTTAIDGAFSMMDKRIQLISEQKITPRVEQDKPGIFSEENIERRNRRLDETLDLQKVFVDRQYNIANTEVEMLEIDKEKIEKRMNYLSLQEQSRGLTHREYDEFKNLGQMQVEVSRNYEREVLRRNRVENRLDEERRDALKIRSNQSLIQLALEAERQKSNYQTVLENSGRELEIQKERNQEINKTLEYLQKEKEWALAEGNAEASANLIKSEREFLKLKTESEEILRKENERREEALGKINLIENKNKEINEIYKRRTGIVMDLSEEARELEATHGIVSRAMESVGTGYRRAVYGISQVWRGIRDSVGNITDSIRYNTSNFIKELKVHTGRTILNVGKAVATAPLKGMRNLTQGFTRAMKSNIGRMIGPMAIIGIAMKLLQPTIEKLQPVLDVLGEVFNEVLEKLINAIMPVMLKLFSALLPLIATLVDNLLPPLVLALGGVMKGLGWVVDSISWAVTQVNKMLPWRLDGAIEAMSDLGDDFHDASSQLFTTGMEMYQSGNKILGDRVKGLQETLNETAESIGKSADKVAGTGSYGGATVSLDEFGNIRVDDPAKSVVTDDPRKGSPGEGDFALSGAFNKFLGQLDVTSEEFGKMSGGELDSILTGMIKEKELGTLDFKDRELEFLRDYFLSKDHDFADAISKVMDTETRLTTKTDPIVLDPNFFVNEDFGGGTDDKFVNEDFGGAVADDKFVNLLGVGETIVRPIEDNFISNIGKSIESFFDPLIDVSKDLIERVSEDAKAVNETFRAGGFLNDGIIFKDNKIIQTHEDDHIIASKNKPEIMDDTRSARRSIEERNDNREVIEALQQIVSGIEGMLIEGRKTSENLEHIKGYSNKTASNTRYVRTPSMENL